MTNELSNEDVKSMLANPFYCIVVNPDFCIYHQPLITKEKFVEAGVKLIGEIGAKQYLETLLDNMEQKFNQ